MDRRRFMATVGVASAAAVVDHGPGGELGARRTVGAAGPAAARRQVDNRFLDVLTRVNDLQVPGVPLGLPRQQIDTLASPRALAQSALRLVSAYVNPRGQNLPQRGSAGTAEHAAGRAGRAAEPERPLRHRQPGQPAGHLVRHQRPRARLRPAAPPTTSRPRGGPEKYAAIMQQVGPVAGRGRRAHPEPPLGDLQGAGAPPPPVAEPAAAGPDQRLAGRGHRPGRRGRVQRAQPELRVRGHQPLAGHRRPAGRQAARCWTTSGATWTMTLYRLEANGEVETVQSRRQDQTGIQDVWKYLMHFRELAMVDDDPRFAAVAEQILDRVAADPDVVRHRRLLRRRVPGRGARLSRPRGRAARPGAAGHPVREVLPGLAARPDPPRRRHGASVFGGTDWHNRREDSVGQPTAIREIASGLSTNPTFFKLRKGAAILDSVRMSPRFFSTGHFRSDGVTPVGGGWRLHDRVRGPVPPAAPAAVPPPGRRLRPRLRGPVLLQDGLPAPAQAVQGAGHRGHHPAGRRRRLRPGLRRRRADHLADHRALLPQRRDADRRGPGHRGRQLPARRGRGHLHRRQDTITFGPGNGSGIRQPIAMDPGEKYTYLGGSLVPPGNASTSPDWCRSATRCGCADAS